MKGEGIGWFRKNELEEDYKKINLSLSIIMNALISSLSPYLFWDINRDTIDTQTHKRFIIMRTLSRGSLKDLKAILAFYKEEELKREIKEIRSLDDKTANFAAIYFSIPKEEMRCYIWKPSHKKHWDY